MAPATNPPSTVGKNPPPDEAGAAGGGAAGGGDAGLLVLGTEVEPDALSADEGVFALVAAGLAVSAGLAASDDFVDGMDDVASDAVGFVVSGDLDVADAGVAEVVADAPDAALAAAVVLAGVEFVPGLVTMAFAAARASAEGPDWAAVPVTAPAERLIAFLASAPVFLPEVAAAALIGFFTFALAPGVPVDLDLGALLPDLPDVDFATGVPLRF